eukprot:scaffold21052_cov98-Isochrysis_galbana.AAC.1
MGWALVGAGCAARHTAHPHLAARAEAASDNGLVPRRLGLPRLGLHAHRAAFREHDAGVALSGIPELFLQGLVQRHIFHVHLCDPKAAAGWAARARAARTCRVDVFQFVEDVAAVQNELAGVPLYQGVAAVRRSHAGQLVGLVPKVVVAVAHLEALLCRHVVPTRERVDDEVIPFLGHGATGGGPGELLVEEPASLLPLGVGCGRRDVGVGGRHVLFSAVSYQTHTVGARQPAFFDK